MLLIFEMGGGSVWSTRPQPGYESKMQLQSHKFLCHLKNGLLHTFYLFTNF